MDVRIPVAAAAFLLALPVAAHAAGDAAKGEKVFLKCKICHQIGPTAKNAVGPEQNDLIGRKAGTVAGYSYSPAMKEAGEKGLVWNEENIGKYLANPREFIPHNKMAFVGLPSEQDRQDVIAYLKKFTK